MNHPRLPRNPAEESDKKTFEEKQKAARETIAEIELNAIANGGRIPTDEELEPKKGKLSAMADRLEAEANCIGACEKLQKLAAQFHKDAKPVKTIVDHGTIPDNGGVSMGQFQDGMNKLFEILSELTSLVPEES